MHDRNAELHTRVIQQIATGEIVCAIDDDVITTHDVKDVFGGETSVIGDHVDIGVQSDECLFGGVDFALAHPVEVVQDLTLQV